MRYEFQPYDVLQIARDGEWLDFSTLRTHGEAGQAFCQVSNGWWDGKPAQFRIVRQVIGQGQVVVCDKAKLSDDVAERIVKDSALLDRVLDILRANGLDAHEDAVINRANEAGVTGLIRANSGAEIRFTLTRDVY